MNYDDILNLINKKEEEVKILHEEILDLKKQLGSLKIDNKVNFTKEDKIKIVMDYFRGRNDVFAFRLINKNNGSSYYMPACINAWKENVCNLKMKKKCNTCQYKVSQPIAKDVVFNHMYGDKTIGIYPLLEDNTCYFLAFDFDNKKNDKSIANEVLAFVSICDLYNIPVALERSRSGKGIHIWIFFKESCVKHYD